jgi:hypothetical protein
MSASSLVLISNYGVLILNTDCAVHSDIKQCSPPHTNGVYHCKLTIVFHLASSSRYRASGMESRTRPSSARVSSQADWEASVSVDHCTCNSPTWFLTAGSLVAGRLSDIVVRRWREKRRGVWYPEDRLRATWIGGLIMAPLSVGASGLITTYIGGPIGFGLDILCLYANGVGVSPTS